MVVILVYAASECVLDRHYGTRGTPFLQIAEEVLKPCTGKDFSVGAAQIASRLFTECATLSLKGDYLLAPSHFFTPFQRRTSASATPIRSITRSTLWSTISITVRGW